MGAFHGAWPALATPFNEQGQVNTKSVRGLVEYLLERRVGGFYVCGSTGEGVYMTVAERKQVTETVIEQVNGRVPVIAHVGCVAIPDAVELARHASSAGADAVASIIPPLYRDVESVYDYFATIGAAIPDTRLLTYIFGGPTDAVGLMQRLMEIPNVAGSKYTGPNMHEFRRIVELGTEYTGPFEWTVFSGMDEECLFASMFGASGNIGSTLNYIPGVYREIHACRKSGELEKATGLQKQANTITQVLFGYGFMGALKAVMGMLGVECGQPRLPNRPFPKEKRDALRRDLEALDFFALADL